MRNSKDKLVAIGIKKLKTLGFINVTRDNLFHDEVYRYHFRIFMNFMKGKNDDLDRSIDELFASLEKKTNEKS
jgi:hypothetical protein